MEKDSYTKKVNPVKERETSEKLMKQVAEEMKIPLSWVKEAIIQGQSKYTAHIMRSNTFDGVRWPLLGKFTAKVKSAQVLKHLKGLTKIQREFFLSRTENRTFKKKFKNLISHGKDNNG